MQSEENRRKVKCDSEDLQMFVITFVFTVCLQPYLPFFFEGFRNKKQTQYGGKVKNRCFDYY